MKVEIEIAEAELRSHIIKEIGDRLIRIILEGDTSLSWEERQTYSKKTQEDLLAKIDWKNAAGLLSETVVQKFFMNLLDKK